MSDHTLVAMCPRFEAAFQLIGKKWNGLIIEALLERDLRFCELRDSINGISDRLLIDRLRDLIAAGVVVKTSVDTDGHQLVTYQLTDKGQDLKQVFSSLHTWADQWVDPASQ